jgi:hypothetical protein
MAYDYWADYEKHFNAMRDAHSVFLRDYGSLSARERQVQQAKESKNPRTINDALSEFARFASAADREGRIVQNLGRSAAGKLNTYIRNVKSFSQSAQHFQNIQAVVDGVEANLRHLQARSRAVRGY